MISVLIVEDNPEKAAALTSVVEAAGVQPGNIRVVPDFLETKSVLKEAAFDVLVIDLRIPRRFGEGTVASGGPELLRWLSRRRNGAPEAILAVSGFEIDALTETELNELGVQQVRYRPDDEKWKSVVGGVVRRVLSRRENSESGERPEAVDFVIQTTTDVELDAVRRVFAIAAPGHLIDQQTWYRLGVQVEDETRVVIVTQAPQMGMPAAAVLATKSLRRWTPRWLFLVGVCAGVAGEVNIGDVIVPDPAWDYGSGKLGVDNILRPDPRPIELREEVSALMRHHSASIPFERWRREWPASAPAGTPRLICAPAASGPAVLADGATVDRVKQQSRKLAALEMEAYGFYYAAAHSGLSPAPRFASLKAVVDFADGGKADDFQRYGAHIAAKTTRWLVEHL